MALLLARVHAVEGRHTNAKGVGRLGVGGRLRCDAGCVETGTRLLGHGLEAHVPGRNGEGTTVDDLGEGHDFAPLAVRDRKRGEPFYGVLRLVVSRVVYIKTLPF